MSRVAALVTAALIAAGTLTACSTSSADRSITVAASSSLQAVMATIATQFEQEHPGTTVRIAESNARNVDVIATDTESAMDRLGKQVISPRRFASNSLIIIAPLGNPKHITGFASLGNPDLRVATCSERLPCGASVVRTEHVTGTQLGTPLHVDSGATAVAYVAAGRADAALAYRTQARSGNGVSFMTVDDPVFDQAINRYPIAVVRGSKNDSTAADFIATVLGPEGGRALATAGFGPPSG
ncbi:molybdate ABC transporter substrate-binding protein [Gordonia sp. (in: high G+C Gram-positive bacteria)]|uniref:molybdate ABC transporter substrate-binding protein n=1 Tax=Gordonia sp. (in: high G+C Gram-positive bacteria) TaxID=84139 RepID=UPI003C772777